MVQIRIGNEILPSVADTLRTQPTITDARIEPVVDCMPAEILSVDGVLSVIDAGHPESLSDTDINYIDRVSAGSDEGDYLQADTMVSDVGSDTAESTISDVGSDVAIKAPSTLPIPFAENANVAVPCPVTIPIKEPPSDHVEIVVIDVDLDEREVALRPVSTSALSASASLSASPSVSPSASPSPLPLLCSVSSSSWETVEVPEELSSPVFETKLLWILQKVKDQLKLLSAALSVDPMTAEVSVLIEAPSAKSAVLAKGLIQKHFKQRLAAIDAQRKAEREAENEAKREAEREAENQAKREAERQAEREADKLIYS